MNSTGGIYIFPKIVDYYFTRSIGIRQGHTYHRDKPCSCYRAFRKRWPSLVHSKTFATGLQESVQSCPLQKSCIVSKKGGRQLDHDS